MTDEERLRGELYEVAARLPRSAWYTARVKEFEGMLAAGDVAAARALRLRIDKTWEHYYDQPLAFEERTAETVVGHRLLVEGLAGWQKALDLLITGAPEGALGVAEAANRLLVAVQVQARRLRSAGKS